jgi:hypothetical protein
MDAEALKKLYGAEYPAAVIRHGVRMPLRRERRFSRSYHSEEHKLGTEVSRFMDGSATITAPELQNGWPTWTDGERVDFCQSCDWLHDQPDFSEMLRFIMQHSGPSQWSALASSVAARLPRDEAFDILVRALQCTDVGRSANVAQAISMTKHPEAEPTLRRHLAAIWAHAGLWEHAEFINWVAFDAISCIAHIIELGAAPADFTIEVGRLSAHACARNRDSCRGFLSKHYTWLLKGVA